MRLKVVGSGSSGNSYIVYNDQESLIIECGLPYDKILKALNFNIKNVVGCIISHAHKDHCKSVKEIAGAGIQVYCLKETADSFGFFSHNINHVSAKAQFKVGNFDIVTFELQHDVPCIGFYIRHAETGNFCFITDTYYTEYTFPALNNVIIEANYCESILENRTLSGSNPHFLENRIIQSHMSLQTCKGFLKANDLRSVNNILLIHLSDSNSHAERFKKEVKQQTVKNVHVAEAGLDIAWTISPF